MTDFSWPQAYEGYDDLWITISRFGDEALATAWCDEHLGADGSRLMEHVPELAPADHAFLEDAATANVFAATMSEAFRQGTRGFAQDLTIEGRPWAFDLGTIAVPVRVLHGEADTLAPLAHARHTAELIPGSVLEILPGHGHVSMFNEFPRLIAELATSVALTSSRSAPSRSRYRAVAQSPADSTEPNWHSSQGQDRPTTEARSRTFGVGVPAVDDA